MWRMSRPRRVWLAAAAAAVSVEVARVRRSAAAVAEARAAAETDVVTGLRNRRGVGRAVESAIAAYGGAGLVLLDLDGFKAVNDTFGHAAGDHVLSVVAARLAAVAHPGEVASRHGGDEFSLLLAGPASAELAQRRAREVAEAVAGPVVLPGGQRPEVAVSVGAAVAETTAGLWSTADARMYQAKRTRAGVAA